MKSRPERPSTEAAWRVRDRAPSSAELWPRRPRLGLGPFRTSAAVGLVALGQSRISLNDDAVSLAAQAAPIPSLLKEAGAEGAGSAVSPSRPLANGERVCPSQTLANGCVHYGATRLERACPARPLGTARYRPRVSGTAPVAGLRARTGLSTTGSRPPGRGGGLCVSSPEGKPGTGHAQTKPVLDTHKQAAPTDAPPGTPRNLRACVS